MMLVVVMVVSFGKSNANKFFFFCFNGMFLVVVEGWFEWLSVVFLRVEALILVSGREMLLR